MIEDMTLHMSEAELARDLHAVLAKVQQGAEIVIEQDGCPVAIIKPPEIKGRPISEILAALESRGASGTVDEDFARDVEEAIKTHNEPWNPPSWD